MNAAAPALELPTLHCRQLALAALGALVADGTDAPEARFLRQAWHDAGGAHWPQRLQHALALPAARDAPLQRVAALLQLAPLEMLAVALAAAVEDDPLIGRVLGWLQSNASASRPSLGLLARAFAPLCAHDDVALAEAQALYALAGGAAVHASLLQLDGDECPVCERALRIAPALAAALAGIHSDWPGVRSLQGGVDIDADAALDTWARALTASPSTTLVHARD
jgi:hypothetical protein